MAQMKHGFKKFPHRQIKALKGRKILAQGCAHNVRATLGRPCRPSRTGAVWDCPPSKGFYNTRNNYQASAIVWDCPPSKGFYNGICSWQRARSVWDCPPSKGFYNRARSWTVRGSVWDCPPSKGFYNCAELRRATPGQKPLQPAAAGVSPCRAPGCVQDGY